MIHGSHAMPAPTPSTRSEAPCSSFRSAATRAVMGAVLWVVAPFVPVAARPSFGSIEHVFVFLPLVAAPLALLLLSVLLESGDHSRASFHRSARRIQPVAGAMVLASFLLPSGLLAGALAAGWLVFAVMIAIGGARRAAHVPGRHRAKVSLLAAHVFLPIGAVWLLLSRLGIAPRDLTAPTVFLAALHFHFSGFALQILIAATGLQLPDRGSWLSVLHRALAIGAIAGIPMIAAGNIGHSPVLKFLGVSAMVASTLALAITSTAAAWNLPGRAARLLLLVSAASITAGMVFAGAYGVGELTGRSWIGIPRMVATHGLLNALGFTLFGLLGHLRLRLVGGGSWASRPRTLGGAA
jgi:hypothetical protein